MNMKLNRTLKNSEQFEELSDVYEERYGKELEIVVFAVKVSDLNRELLSIDTNQQYDEEGHPNYFYNGIIPFNKLKRVKL